MMYVVGGLIFLFLIFFLIGLGPTLLFLNKDLTPEKIVIFSPIVGYIFTVILGVYLVLLNFPVGAWAWVYTLFSILFSAWLFKFSKQKIKFVKPLISLYCCVFLLLVLPLLLGGINFAVLRGNGTDAFNYMSMAGFLQHEPWYLLKTASFQELLDKHASYPLAKELLTERWATSMILAYFSSLVHIPIYRLDYAYNLIFFWISAGIFYLYIKNIFKNHLWLIILLAVICSTGFWAQLILDTRAMSQMSVLPVILMFSYLFVELRKSDTQYQVLLGLSAASIVYLYVEIVPLVVLTLGLYLAVDFVQKRNFREILKPITVILLTSIFFVLPAFDFLLAFLEKQMHLAVGNKINWHLAYFSWLYDFPLMGLWGLGPFSVHSILIKLGIGFASLMSMVFVYGLMRSLVSRINSYSLLSSCFVLASLIIFSFLYLNSQYWSAGKILSYAYPYFIFIFLVGVGLLQETRFKKISYVILLLWMISQLFLAFMRISLVIIKKDFPHYVYGHGYYRQHDFNDNPFKNISCHAILVDINDGWLEEYFNLVFGWNYSIFNPHGVHNRENQVIGRQNQKTNYDCLFTKIDQNEKNVRVLGKNKEFELIQLEEGHDQFKN